MKKLNLLALSALMASSWLTAGAQDLGQATSVLPELTTTTANGTYSLYTIDGGYSVGTTSLMLLSWGGQELTYTENGGGKDGGTIALQGGSNPNLKYYLNSTYSNGTGSSTTLCMYLSFGTLTAGVTYTFTVPEGLVQNEAGQTNAAQTFTFTRGNGGYISTTSYASFNKIPSIINSTAQGTVYSASDLKNFEVTCLNNTTGVWTLEPATDASYIINAIEKTSGQIVNLTSNFSIKDGKLVGDLSSLAAGSWNVFIPQGYAHYYNASNTLYVVNGVMYNFEILDDSAFEPLPSEATLYGATIGTALPQYNTSFPSTLNVSWNGQPIAVAEDAPAVTLTSGTMSYDCTLSGASKVTNGQTEYCLKVTPPTPVPTAGGVYTLTIPAGVVKSGSYENEEVTFDINLTPVTNNVTITPTPGTVALSGFDGITIEFPGATTVAQAGEWTTSPTLTAPGASATNLVLGSTITIDSNKVIIPVSSPVVGNYVLNIPANLFVVDNAALNPAIKQTFTVADGLSSAIVIDGPKAISAASTAVYATTDFNLELTWDYQVITPTNSSVTVSYSGGSFTLTQDNGIEFVSVPDANGNPVDGNNAVKLNIGEQLSSKIASTPSAGSKVTVSLPASWVSANGKQSPAQSFEFTTYKEIAAAPTFGQYVETGKDPIEGQYVIKWGSDALYLISQLDNNSFISVVDENGVETVLNKVSSTTNIAPGSFGMVAANPIVFDIRNLPKGLYTINIPEAFWKAYTLSGGSSNYWTNGAYSHQFEYGTPYTVSLTIKGDGLDTNDYYKLVNLQTLTDPTEGITEEVELTEDSYSMTYYGPTGFVITPVEGYVITVTANPESLQDAVVDMGDFTIISLDTEADFDNASFTVTVAEYVPPTTDVTLNYVAEEGVEGDFWKYVTVVYEELSSGEGHEGTPTTVNPESATTTFTLTPTATISFEPTEGYLVSVTTEADEDVVEVKNGNVTSATIFFGAPAEVAFNVTVSVDPDYVTPVDVTLNFSNGIGVEDAWKLVSVEVSDTEGEDLPVVDGSQVTFTVNPEATITFNVTEGYMLSVATSETDETVVIDGNEITIAAHAPAEVSFTVTVSVAPIDVTLNFTAGEDVEEDPWSVVSVAVKDAEGESAPTVNENPFTFGVYPSATISFTAAEGYLVSVTAETEDAVVVNENEVTITIGAPETVELNVEVTLEESDAIHGINVENIKGEVYTLQGLRVKSGKLAPGIYIINGKKVAVK